MNRANLYDEVEKACHAIARQQFWREGWLAMQHSATYGRQVVLAKYIGAAIAIGSTSRPKDLAQNVRAIVLSNRLLGIEYDELELDLKESR